MLFPQSKNLGSEAEEWNETEKWKENIFLDIVENT